MDFMDRDVTCVICLVSICLVSNISMGGMCRRLHRPLATVRQQRRTLPTRPAMQPRMPWMRAGRGLPCPRKTSPRYACPLCILSPLQKLEPWAPCDCKPPTHCCSQSLTALLMYALPNVSLLLCAWKAYMPPCVDGASRLGSGSASRAIRDELSELSAVCERSLRCLYLTALTETGADGEQ